MNIIAILNNFILFFYQTMPDPLNPGNGGDTGIDAPIDNYLIVGLILGVVIASFAIYKNNLKKA